MKTETAEHPFDAFDAHCPSRRLLDTIGDKWASLVIVALGAIELGDRMSIPVLTGLATRVKAEVGRPRSPVSVAGVARRSARRD